MEGLEFTAGFGADPDGSAGEAGVAFGVEIDIV